MRVISKGVSQSYFKKTSLKDQKGYGVAEVSGYTIKTFRQVKNRRRIKFWFLFFNTGKYCHMFG